MSQLSDLVSVFKQFLTDQQLVNQRLLLLVSGGVDSVVLLHVATQVVATEQLAVFHLNHNARPASARDANFVQNLCTKYGIRSYSHSLDPGIQNNGTQPSRDQENQWRKQRLKHAQDAAQNFGAERILTAHHATDLAETMIFRLTKGCGPNGLSPFDISTKPFWQIPKSSLKTYAEKNQLKWAEDESNLNTNFERNAIRHEILPVLRKITPNLEKVFVREAQTFAQVQNFIEATLKERCGIALAERAIKLETFLALDPLLQNELLRTIAAKTPSQSELENCLKWLQNQPKGSTQKDLGGTNITLLRGTLQWA